MKLSRYNYYRGWGFMLFSCCMTVGRVLVSHGAYSAPFTCGHHML